MSLFHLEQSAEGFDSRYGVFTPRPVNTATKQELFIDYRPISQIKTGQIIEFNVPNSSTYYMDLSRTRLHLKVRLLKANGDKTDATSKVGLINNALHSLWRQCDLALQQKIISPEIGVCYPYKSLLDNLLNHTKSQLDSKYNTQMFYKDTALL